MTPLPDYDEALARALDGVRALEEETVGLNEIANRVTREPIVADRDLPPFDRAQMDGYAVRFADLGSDRALPVAGTVAAGAFRADPVPPGACVKIATGAPVPSDLDTVIQHERSDRGDPVRLDAGDLAIGHAIHPRGADARAGDMLVPAGTMLGPQHVGLAAAVGATALRVTRRPRATILTSGDEVRAPGEPVAAHQIRNSNAPQTTELLRRFGAGEVATRHVPDDLEATIEAVGDALRGSDLVLTVGGVSAGERDHFPTAFDHHRVERRVHGAAIQPGKPVIVGVAVQETGAAVTIVALPGNPVSGLACACLFAWPIVRAMLGLDPSLPWRTVTLEEPVRPNARRRAFRPGVLTPTGDGIVIPRWAGSGDLAHTARTDGLVRLPVQADEVPVGTPVPFLPFPHLGM